MEDKKIWKSKLNSGYTVKAVNSRAVVVVRYDASFIRWRKDKVRTIESKARKTMRMHRVLQPQGDVDRLLISKKNDGKGMISVKDFVRDGKRKAGEVCGK